MQAPDKETWKNEAKNAGWPSEWPTMLAQNGKKEEKKDEHDRKEVKGDTSDEDVEKEKGEADKSEGDKDSTEEIKDYELPEADDESLSELHMRHDYK